MSKLKIAGTKKKFSSFLDRYVKYAPTIGPKIKPNEKATPITA